MAKGGGVIEESNSPCACPLVPAEKNSYQEMLSGEK